MFETHQNTSRPYWVCNNRLQFESLFPFYEFSISQDAVYLVYGILRVLATMPAAWITRYRSRRLRRRTCSLVISSTFASGNQPFCPSDRRIPSYHPREDKNPSDGWTKTMLEHISTSDVLPINGRYSMTHLRWFCARHWWSLWAPDLIHLLGLPHTAPHTAPEGNLSHKHTYMIRQKAICREKLMWSKSKASTNMSHMSHKPEQLREISTHTYPSLHIWLLLDHCWGYQDSGMLPTTCADQSWSERQKKSDLYSLKSTYILIVKLTA